MNASIRAMRGYAAEQRAAYSRMEREEFNRVYLDGGHGYAVCDEATPQKAELYRRAAGGLIGIEVILDTDGTDVPRGLPPEGNAWAIIDPVSVKVSDAYWDVLEPMLDELAQGAQNA